MSPTSCQTAPPRNRAAQYTGVREQIQSSDSACLKAAAASPDADNRSGSGPIASRRQLPDRRSGLTCQSLELRTFAAMIALSESAHRPDHAAPAAANPELVRFALGRSLYAAATQSLGARSLQSRSQRGGRRAAAARRIPRCRQAEAIRLSTAAARAATSRPASRRASLGYRSDRGDRCAVPRILRSRLRHAIRDRDPTQTMAMPAPATEAPAAEAPSPMSRSQSFQSRRQSTRRRLPARHPLRPSVRDHPARSLHPAR